MKADDFDLLSLRRGSIVAPAGCGKTQLIADALQRHRGPKPVLILTHTNAGVAALKARLAKAKVPTSTYSLSTIDGWAMRLVGMFPKRSGVDASVLKIVNPGRDYATIKRAALTILKAGHLKKVIQATFSNILVDEYQDCSVSQHEIVCELADGINTCVLGDPMQAIFGFAGVLVDWDKQVRSVFPQARELDIPWRWRNTGAAPLGEWLLTARRSLMAGKPIDLKTAPKEVTWIKLDRTSADFEKLLEAAGTKSDDKNDSVLVIGDSRRAESRHKIASAVPGAVTVETVDLRDLVSFAEELDLQAAGALSRIVHFAQGTMTGVGGADLLKRVNTILGERSRKKVTDVENAAVSFVKEPSYRKVAELLEAIQQEGGVRVYRPLVVRACMLALLRCRNGQINFSEAAIQMREQNRALGRTLPRRAVGSTLLLKGLEAEIAVVLDANALDARNLYVAITRGSKGLVICSSEPILLPT